MSRADLQRGLQSLGVRALDDKQLTLVMQELDHDGDGTVTFAEFIDALWLYQLDSLIFKLAVSATYGLKARRRGADAAADDDDRAKQQHDGFNSHDGRMVDWAALFRRYDRNTDGDLSYDEFRLAVRKDARIAPTQLSDSELHEVFDHVDSSGDGTIDIAEFVALMSNVGSPSAAAAVRKKQQQLAAISGGAGSPLRQRPTLTWQNVGKYESCMVSKLSISQVTEPSVSAEVNEKRGRKAVNNPPTVNPTMVQRRIDAAKGAGARKREAAEASREAMVIERQGRNSEQAYAAYVQENTSRTRHTSFDRHRVPVPVPSLHTGRHTVNVPGHQAANESGYDPRLLSANDRTQAWIEGEEGRSVGLWSRWNALPATDLRRCAAVCIVSCRQLVTRASFQSAPTTGAFEDNR